MRQYSRWDIEQKLARIWKDALDVQHLTRKDDFFTLGGDSVAATKVVTAIEEVFDRKLPMSALVENPTIQLLAGRIESATEDAADDGSILVPVRPIVRPIVRPFVRPIDQSTANRPPLFLVHGLMGHVVYAYVLAKFMGDDQPMYALRAKGFDGQPPLNDVMEMAAIYAEQIRAVQPRGPYYIVGNCSGAFIALEIARLFQKQGDSIGLMAALDPLEAGVSFNQKVLRAGPWKPGDEQSPAFRSNLRKRLEIQVFGRGGVGQQKMEHAIDVAVAVDIAIAKYHPVPYSGLITILASDDFIPQITRQNGTWRQLSTGGSKVAVVAHRHSELFLHRGPLVASLIRKAMDGGDITVRSDS